MSETIRPTGDAFAREFDRLRRKVDGLSGAGVTNTRDSINIGKTSSKQPPPPPPDAILPQRMKVKTAADSNGVAVCNSWDGSTAGDVDVNVRVIAHKGVGEELFAMIVGVNAGVQKDGADVTYLEYATNYTYPVKLSVESGGSAGSKTTGCTYTYTVKDAATNSITLGTGMTPAMQRRTSVGKFTAATAGLACFVGNTFTLWDSDERPAKGSC